MCEITLTLRLLETGAGKPALRVGVHNLNKPLIPYLSQEAELIWPGDVRATVKYLDRGMNRDVYVLPNQRVPRSVQLSMISSQLSSLSSGAQT